MCGICGVVMMDPTASRSGNRRDVEKMLEALKHRGPDDAGVHESDGAILGAARLAIRGPEDGRQPLVDAASGIIAVCSGEIDNHHELRAWLATRGREVPQKTDVAVIPGLYAELGEAFVEKLVGVFALAVWDPRNRRLTLARDRAGERPLFFSREGHRCSFASELAAVVGDRRIPVTLQSNALRQYLQFGVFPAPQSPFVEVQKIAPGEIVALDMAGTSRRSYWRWRNVETAKTERSLDEFDRIFRESVRKQSDVDVEFGVFLSGGIDSSLVSAVTRSLHPDRPLKAYTLRFEEESFDEGSFAESVARQLKLEPVTVWVRAADMQEGLRSLVRKVGEPLGDPAWVPTALLARRAAQDIKIALVGEGADELFGGYPTYLGAGLAERFARLPGPLRSLARRAVQSVPPSEKKMTLSFLLKRFVDAAETPGLARHLAWVSSIPPALLKRLGVEAHAPEIAEESGLLLDRIQRWDLETSLAEGLLTKADRGSMSSALELRAPFLDESVMDFAAHLPVEDRVRRFQTKVFLKRYALRYLPREIVYRRKRGLSVPLAKWLRGPLREWAEATLANPRLERAGLRPSSVSELFAEHLQRKADHARALWTLLALSEWLNWVFEETAIDSKPMAGAAVSETRSDVPA